MSLHRKRRPVLIILRVALLVYLGFLLLMAGCQRSLIYYPSRATEAELLREAADLGLKEWRDGDGRLIGWKEEARSLQAVGQRAVVFHGNAGMAIDRGYYASGLQSVDGGGEWEVYLFEYPGYGARQGPVSEKAFYRAARAALDQLLMEGDLPVFLVGESLGSGVAAQMAADFAEDVQGLLLVTPFTTLPDVGARHFPFLPVRWLLWERYNNVAALANYRGPLAVVLAEEDEVVPADLGKRLYDLYQGPKMLWIQKGLNHNSLDLSSHHPWWGEAVEFLQRGSELD
jgi:pimeloyl-ACP methyl ester carboxylesterase